MAKKTKNLPAKNPGQTAPAELEKRVDQVVKLLRSRHTKGEIKQEMKRLHGVDARTVERYLSRARQIIVDDSDKPKIEHVADAYLMYNKIIADPKALHRDKIKAQDSINKLLGLNVPFRVAQTDAEGNDVEPGNTTEVRILALINQVHERVGEIRDVSVTRGT